MQFPQVELLVPGFFFKGKWGYSDSEFGPVCKHDAELFFPRLEELDLGDTCFQQTVQQPKLQEHRWADKMTDMAITTRLLIMMKNG